MPCQNPDCTVCRSSFDFQRGVRAAVALVRETAALYASHEGKADEVSSDYPARVALDSAASNIELTLLPQEHE